MTFTDGFLFCQQNYKWGLMGIYSKLHRKLSGGKTLIEVIREEGDIRNAAIELDTLLAKEQAQRETLNGRLIGHRHHDYITWAAPILDEND